MEVLVETLHPDLRGAAYGPGWPMRDLLAQDGGAHIFEPFVYPGNCKGGGGAEKPHEIALGIPGDHRVRNILPAIGAVDVAVAQGAAFQHAEPVEQEKQVVAECSRNGRSRQQTGVCRAVSNRANGALKIGKSKEIIHHI